MCGHLGVKACPPSCQPLVSFLTRSLLSLQALICYEGQACIREDTRIVLSTAWGAADVCLLYHIPDLQVA